MLPEGFRSSLAALGLADAVDALESSAPEVSVRLNPRKATAATKCRATAVPNCTDAAVPNCTDAACRVSLAKGSNCSPVPWCYNGYYLPERPVFTLDPAWHQGRYYVQEASSMFHSHVVRSLFPSGTAPLRVLDACAAPGGKTTAVMDALPTGSLMVANEFVPARAAILRENIIKWGNPATIVTRGDTAPFARMDEAFDLIIADVPCSGEGMMRKDADAVAQWSPALVADCAALQWEIVRNLWPALRPGGYMVYSTCTFNRSEDEEMIHRIIEELGAESVEIPVEPEWGITPALNADGSRDASIHACRFIPGRTRGEGLFVSALRKVGMHPGASAPSAPSATKRDKHNKHDKKSKSGSQSIDSSALKTLRSWLGHAEDYDIILADDRVTAFPKAHRMMLDTLSGLISVIHEGVTLATVKGRDLVPAHALAMSTALSPAAFPRVEVDRDMALRYLRGESPVLPSGTLRGFTLLTYQNEPLGFVKNLGSRSNSLYPAPWRIKMSI